ncbi:putative 4-hydroxy-4-methyl-2-oxoglutarate aldolase [Vibrio gangliei]|uniref:putative 4-hydroxy-4-methyl-2-oxoglutarate aldolase n=1 Tax=Vibrio gangliei TaxID=2077090 RepID=UPI000D01BAD3|nr:putative 4-hydroxy-4-methyl-2-oxoglutarate aldolase [Vibrio gangliei]
MKDLLPELCDRYAEQLTLIPAAWKSFGGKVAFYGEVVTLRCYLDNSLVREILSQKGNGKVLLVDGNGALEKALLGDQLAILAQENGWQGVIVYGAVRDVHTLSQIDLGVQALGASPFKTDKRGAGEKNTSLEIAGVTVLPGDYIYADWNGVLISTHAVDMSEFD